MDKEEAELWVPVWSSACFLWPWVAVVGDSSLPRHTMGPKTPTCEKQGATCLQVPGWPWRVMPPTCLVAVRAGRGAQGLLLSPKSRLFGSPGWSPGSLAQSLTFSGRPSYRNR